MSHLGWSDEGYDACLCFLVLFVWFLETKFHCVALVGQELLWLGWNSEIHLLLPPGAELKRPSVVLDCS